MDVIGFGESSVDYVHVVSGLPREGSSKLRIVSRYSTVGGQVATTMAACAALELEAGYLGPVGNDENGLRVQDVLRRRGVDLSRLVVRKAATRYALIMVDHASGDRVVLWDRDAALDLPAAELATGMVRGARVVHVDGTDEAASIEIARLGRAAGAVVTCDVDTVTTRTAELLAQVTMPILAESVPEALTGLSDTEAALRVLRRTHDGVLVVTSGERGAAALDRDRFVQVPAAAVEAVDTTGAGDVFRAGFIYGLIHHWPVERTLRFANAAAALSCTRAGAIDGAPSLADVLAMTSPS